MPLRRGSPGFVARGSDAIPVHSPVHCGYPVSHKALKSVNTVKYTATQKTEVGRTIVASGMAPATSSSSNLYRFEKETEELSASCPSFAATRH